MPIIHHGPMSLLTELHREMNRLFSEDFSFSEEETALSATEWSPRVDIIDKGNHYLIKADVPGVDPKDIEIKMENNVLSIKGMKHAEQKEEKAEFSRIERSSGNFYRRISLPDTLNGEGIRAKTKHGVLEIKVPKQKKAKTRLIEVKSED